MLDDERLSITEERVLGFKQAISESQNIEIKQEIFFVSNALEAETTVLSWWKKDIKPTELFVMSDEILAGVLSAFKKLNLNILNELNIVAISDGYFSKFSSLNIPYVETSGYLLGKKATELVFQLIEDPSLPVDEHFIETKFVG